MQIGRTSSQAALHGCLPADEPLKLAFAKLASALSGKQFIWRQTRCFMRVLLRVFASCLSPENVISRAFVEAGIPFVRESLDS
jgi:hypothetical protein